MKRLAGLLSMAAALPPVSSAVSPRECNTQLGSISRAEVLASLNAIYATDPSTVSFINDVLAPNVLKYDVATYKICGSCKDVEFGDLMSSACDANMYGYDALHSALVLVPVDPNTGNVVSGSLRSFMNFHGTRVNIEEVPTNVFPSSLEGLTSGDPTIIAPLLGAMGEVSPAMASAGNVVIAPDYLGYGESQSTHNRTYIVKSSYEQAAVVPFKITHSFLSNMSNGCTQIDSVASIEGSSEGGYGAIAGASALEEIGTRIFMLRPNTPVLDINALATYSVSQFDQGLISPDKDNKLFPLVLPLQLWAYSQDNPALANTGYPNQTFLSPEWAIEENFDRNVAAWLESPDPLPVEEYVPLMPPFAPDIIRNSILELLREAIANNDTDFCSGSITAEELIERQLDKVCEASEQNNLTPYLESVSFPTQVCYSEADTVIPAFQFEEAMFDNNAALSRAVGSDGFYLSEGLDHGAANVACIFTNLLTYLSLGVSPDADPSDLPFSIIPIDGSEDNCIDDPVAEPTAAPVPSTESTPSPTTADPPTMDTSSAAGLTSALYPWSILAASLLTSWACSP